ncbi:selenocysteine-specific elongation factor SelB [Solirubrobacter pauli]|uniref:Selenocysteine-specific elongation factor n=1 Tax=Solirubrobacter pauli TaxID=166793 RepID=A0A660LIQ8_9ACTN|nr:selenocysteine-specific translation elongation factor [Solirubrobacter pauli]RKQ92821.1 selenocysteine-specific elongation factor SelB [Solirubrobacter pauli]
MPLTLGTAGHIDHGKTALVEALTGVDTDRLPEEKARGISIALGYAPLALPSGTRLSVVDVPGHEKFVRTMVAGATGIDLYLMVVAADDGVMPQTREHATVLAALGVTVGVVAITKADVTSPERAASEAASLFPGAEVVAVSSRTGEGLDELRAALDRAAAQVASRVADGPARLHVDRVFTIRGAGTVVTGTLWSGAVTRGDQITVLPAGLSARVRSVEVHDEPVDRAEAGQRVALNLVGLDRAEVARGDVITSGDLVEATYRVDVALTWATPDARPEGGARVGVHHGTRESAARLVELGGRFFQLRLEEPIVPAAGDKLVIRSLAPPDTLGGGVVLDPGPRRHGPSRGLLARLARLERGEPEPEAPAEATPPPQAERAPLSPRALELEAELLDAAHEPPLDQDAAALAELREHGRAARLGPTMHVHVDVLATVRERVVAAIERDGSISLAGLRDELGTSRKYAQAYLERFDGEKLTLRRGEMRVLRRRSP